MSAALAGARVLVVGATGHLGRQVADALLDGGATVRALVRPGSAAAPLAARGVEVAPGDLLDAASLARACDGVDAVVTTAIGYSNRRPGDFGAGTDDAGNRNLVAAAVAAGVGRFVFTSVLTCDRAPQVPHFAAKARVEDLLARSGLRWTALRPGAFIDQSQDFWIGGLRKGRLDALGDPDVRWTYVHTHDLARLLAAACVLPPEAPSRIDIGCDRPVSMREIAGLMATLLGRPLKLRALPWWLGRLLFGAGALRNPWLADFSAMFSYILEGGYVADTAAQARWFGPPPRIEDALARYLRGVGLTGA